MRPWRDIPSARKWNLVCQTGDTTAKISRVKQLKAKFDRSADTPSRSLARIGEMIGSYHRIEKTDYGRLAQRAEALREIANAADAHLRKFRVDMEYAKQRHKSVYRATTGGFDRVPAERSQYTGRHDSGSSLDQSIDRLLLTLRNRGLRKAAYIDQLRDYYQTTSRDPRDLVAALARPQDKDAWSTGLAPGVRMEAIDPWHRPVEVGFENGQLKEEEGLLDEYSSSTAFAQWYGSITRHGLPFFLWLEGHPICRKDNKELTAGTASVNYVDVSDRTNGYDHVPSRHRLCLVYAHGSRLWMDELKLNGATRVADTSAYSCNSSKGVSDAAAYTWTGREIAIAQHQESDFHHSSFFAGRAVRCAGMIKIVGGYVTYVSNNSGHYKPGKNLLYAFVQHLSRSGMLSPDCEVHCSGLAHPYRGSAQDFLRNAGMLA